MDNQIIRLSKNTNLEVVLATELEKIAVHSAVLKIGHIECKVTDTFLIINYMLNDNYKYDSVFNELIGTNVISMEVEGYVIECGLKYVIPLINIKLYKLAVNAIIKIDEKLYNNIQSNKMIHTEYPGKFDYVTAFSQFNSAPSIGLLMSLDDRTSRGLKSLAKEKLRLQEMKLEDMFKK